MRVVGLLLLIGCGHVGAQADARDIDVPDAPAPDAPAPDAPVPDATVPDAPELPTGLVAWYPMEAVASRTVVDATGNHHDATCDLTLGACPLSTPYGRIENAYVLDGSNDLLRVESAPAFEQSSAFTITAWVFGDAGSVGGCIVNKGFGGADNSWQACIDSNGMLKFHSVGAGGFHTQTAGILTVERWYHVALWWNGSTKTTYVDGMVAATISNISIIFDHSPITIGGDIDDGKLVLPFKGRVDDVQIYDRALTGDELRALAAGGSPRG